jgi:hypothetical protein
MGVQIHERRRRCHERFGQGRLFPCPMVECPIGQSPGRLLSKIKCELSGMCSDSEAELWIASGWSFPALSRWRAGCVILIQQHNRRLVADRPTHRPLLVKAQPLKSSPAREPESVTQRNRNRHFWCSSSLSQPPGGSRLREKALAGLARTFLIWINNQKRIDKPRSLAHRNVLSAR